MTSQPSLEARPDEFPYEQLLAYYRGRVRNREQADVMERLTSEDARWKAHWQSVQNLDLKREAFRRDGELLSLPAFLEGLIPELCEIIAETDGEVLHPLFSDEPPQQLAGHDLAEWRALCAENVYARAMRRRAYSAWLRRQAKLPDSEELLGDWLLGHYDREPLTRVTQVLALRGAMRRKQELAPSHDAGGLLSLDQSLVSSLEDALARPADERARALRKAVFYFDPLATLAAGEGDEAVPARPLWFTHVLGCPREIAWSDDPAHAPWKVRLVDARGQELFQSQANSLHVLIPSDVHRRVPVEEDVRWEVRRAAATDGPLVCGVFRMVNSAAAAEATARLRELALAEPGVNRDLAIAQLQYEVGLYDASVEHLERLVEEYPRGAAGFLVQRALSAVYGAVRRELTGQRNLGHREGLWAAQLANERLESAYAALGIKFQLQT